jgi:non-heme chloroperoxidase
MSDEPVRRGFGDKMAAMKSLKTGAKVGAMLIAFAALGTVAMAPASQAANSEWIDASPQRIRMVTVAPDVQLETLDWGGSGPPIVLLAGFGNTAHIFDDLATNLRAHFHVYGVTRRGFGKSSVPQDGYDTDRLADDVVGALNALKLKRVVLVGHSIAGLEVASVGSRYPDRVAGLVYLDTTYLFNKDDKDLFGVADWHQDLQALRSRLDALEAAQNNPPPEVHHLLDTEWPHFQKDLELLLVAEDARPSFVPPGPSDLASFAAFRAWFGRMQGFEPPEAELRESFTSDAHGAITGQKSPQWVSEKILAGQKQYAGIVVPTLGLFAVGSMTNPNLPDDEKSRREIDALVTIAKARATRRAEAFRHGTPNAKIVFVERTPHHLFLAKPDEVRQEIESFAAALPKQ